MTLATFWETFLLLQQSFTFTSFFLASICKGIKLVTLWCKLNIIRQTDMSAPVPVFCRGVYVLSFPFIYLWFVCINAGFCGKKLQELDYLEGLGLDGGLH